MPCVRVWHGNQRHRDGGDEIEELRERVELRKPGAVVRIKRDGFHDIHLRTSWLRRFASEQAVTDDVLYARKPNEMHPNGGIAEANEILKERRSPQIR